MAVTRDALTAGRGRGQLPVAHVRGRRIRRVSCRRGNRQHPTSRRLRSGPRNRRDRSPGNAGIRRGRRRRCPRPRAEVSVFGCAEVGEREAQIASELRCLAHAGPDASEQALTPGRRRVRLEPGADPPEQGQQARFHAPARPLQRGRRDRSVCAVRGSGTAPPPRSPRCGLGAGAAATYGPARVSSAASAGASVASGVCIVGRCRR